MEGEKNQKRKENSHKRKYETNDLAFSIGFMVSIFHLCDEKYSGKIILYG